MDDNENRYQGGDVKTIIIYSSITGNTKKLAHAIYNHKSTFDIMAVEDVNDLKAYDRIYLGYWVNRGTADEATLKLLKDITNKEIAAFGTSGQYSDSPVSLKYSNSVNDLILSDNVYLGGYICLGKIEESRTERRLKIAKGEKHYLTEEGYKRHLESRKHPDEEDIDRLLRWVDSIEEKYEISD
nr:flavodoxin family protein [Acidaminobacter sp. JC074]